jgi:hypothetical protein
MDVMTERAVVANVIAHRVSEGLDVDQKLIDEWRRLDDQWQLELAD